LFSECYYAVPYMYFTHTNCTGDFRPSGVPKPLNRLTLKFGIIDYVRHPTPHAKIGGRVKGWSGAGYGWSCHLACFFPSSFLNARTAHPGLRIVAWRVLASLGFIRGHFSPGVSFHRFYQKTRFWGVNRHFKPNLQKNEIPIFKTTVYIGLTLNLTSWCELPQLRGWTYINIQQFQDGGWRRLRYLHEILCGGRDQQRKVGYVKNSNGK